MAKITRYPGASLRRLIFHGIIIITMMAALRVAVAGSSDASPSAASAAPMQIDRPDIALSGSGFTIAPLAVGAPAFDKSPHYWTTLPAAFNGWGYTQARWKKKPSITVTAKRDLTVQIITDVQKGIPHNLAKWQQPGTVFIYDGNRQLVLFEIKVPAGRQLKIPQVGGAGSFVLLPPTQADVATWLRQHKTYWPKVVTLLQPANFPVVVGGTVAGSATVPAGTSVELMDIGANRMEASFAGGVQWLALGATDLQQRGLEAMQRAAIDAGPSSSAGENAAAPAAPSPAAHVASLATPTPEPMPSVAVQSPGSGANLSSRRNENPGLAQDAAGTLAPELAPLVAKYNAALATIEQRRAAELAPYTPFYITALQNEERSALSRADIDAVAAIRKERDAINSGGIPDLITSAYPDKLPQSLKDARDEFFERYKSVDTDMVALRHQADADYLRALDALQATAASGSELARQIKAESDAVLNNGVVTPEGDVEVQGKPGLLVNPDLSQVDANGLPVGWKLVGPHGRSLQMVPDGTKISVVKENGRNLLRFDKPLPDRTGEGLIQEIDLRKETRVVEVSVLARGTPINQDGLLMGVFYLGDNGDPEWGIGHGWLMASGAHLKNTWSEYGLTSKLENVPNHTGIKKMRILIFLGGGTTGTYDFERLKVNFRY